MNSFDPKNKKDPRTFGHRDGDGRKVFPNRDDSGTRSTETPASMFARDKRPRTGRPANDERRSFNPNFTKDNRKKGSGTFSERDGYGDPSRSRREYRSAGGTYDRGSRNEPYGEFSGRRGYGATQRDDRNGYGNRSRQGTDARYRDGEEREGRDRNFRGDRPAKEHRAYREERSDFSGERPRYERDSRMPYGKDARSRSGKNGQHKKFKTYGKDNYPRFDAPKANGAVRLNRFIANSGICSRREADDLITAGLVTVNGTLVTELGSKVNPGDEVRFNGEVIRGEKKVYIVMNKPKGYVTSLEDPHADKTVMDLIRGACTERVYPVGRLDKNSVGVLLITNDGELTRKLTHPSYNKRKVYQVSLDKALTEADMEKIAEGIVLEDGPVYADEISIVSENRREAGIEIHSGRNRIVRRIFESLGYTVQKLDRVYFAGLTKKNLKRGGWRFLSPKEVAMLKSGEYE